MKDHPNLTLLAGLALSILSVPLLGHEGLMVIAAIPGVGLLYACLPFVFLQLLLCSLCRNHFRLVRFLPLILVGPIHLWGWYSLLTTSGAYGIPGLLIIIFTTLPTLGTGLGWAAWAILRRRDIL